MKPTAYILRGIPGSGKSTYAKAVSSVIDWNPFMGDSVIASADNYFVGSDGVYRYDPSKIRNAHAQCRDTFQRTIESDYGLTPIVDNTNSRLWEFAEYIRLAEENGYDVKVIRFNAPIETCIQRCVHGAPPEKIRQMAERFEDYPGEEIIDSYGKTASL